MRFMRCFSRHLGRLVACAYQLRLDIQIKIIWVRTAFEIIYLNARAARLVEVG